MNKRGDSNKACSWEFFLKKNKKNSMLIRDFRVSLSKSFVVCHVLDAKNGQAILFFNLKDVQIEILTIATDFFALTNNFLQMNGHFHK